MTQFGSGGGEKYEKKRNSHFIDSCGLVYYVLCAATPHQYPGQRVLGICGRGGCGSGCYQYVVDYKGTENNRSRHAGRRLIEKI